MATNPVFPLYYNDFDRSTRDWTDEEVGAYIRLLMHQWDKFGLPVGFERLNRIAPTAEKNWAVLSHKFSKTGDILKNLRLEEIRDEVLSFRKRQTENGKKGGRPPGKKKPKNNPPINPKHNPYGNPKQTLLNEVDIEDEVKISNNKGASPKPRKKREPKPPPLFVDIALPWETEVFRDAWRRYKKYRQEQHGFEFKNEDSEQAALWGLHKDAAGMEDAALEMITRSMAAGWKGIFKSKNQTNGTITSQSGKPATGAAVDVQSAFDKIDLMYSKTGTGG